MPLEEVGCVAFITKLTSCLICGRCGSLMVSALVFRSSGLGSSPGQTHCIVFLGRTLHSHRASLHPVV